jgi:hypothetical protein
VFDDGVMTKVIELMGQNQERFMRTMYDNDFQSVTKVCMMKNIYGSLQVQSTDDS